MYADGVWTKLFLSLSWTSTCALWGGTPYRGPYKNLSSFWKIHRKMYCESEKNSHKTCTLEDAGFDCTTMSYTRCTTTTHGFEAGTVNPMLYRWDLRLAPPPKNFCCYNGNGWVYGDGDWTKMFLSWSWTSTCALCGDTPNRKPDTDIASFRIHYA